MVTLERIASLAKVSRSTVSRVINNDPNVSEKTRKRVKQVIEEINYQPNMAARRLAGGRTGVIGLLAPMGVSTLFTDPFFPLVVQGVSSACSTLNYSVILWLAEPEYERRRVRQVINNHCIDGAVIASILIDDPLLKLLIEDNLPFVLIGRYPGNGNVSYVDVDNRTAAFEAVEYLVKVGYRRIATITGPLNMIAGHDRFEGYLEALRHYGLIKDARLIQESDFTEQGGYNAMSQLLDEKPEAVFIASDMMAVGAMHAVTNAGLRIPEDIGILGFDDMPFAAKLEPPLSTVRQPIYQCGEAAAKMLIERIEDSQMHHHQLILPTELVIRETIGSPG